MAEGNNLREQKKQECELHIRKIHQAHPDLADIDKALNSYALSIVRKSLNGEKISTVEADAGYQALRQERLAILEKYGLSEADYQPKWDCPLCEDRGYVRPGVLCSCQRKRQREATYLLSGIPAKYKDMRFDNFRVDYYIDPTNMAQKVERCKKFVTQLAQHKPMGNLVLQGHVGRGKTHLSVAIANAALECGLSVVYRRVDDLLDLIRLYKFERGQDNEETKRVLTLIAQCDLLVLDDIGSELASDFTINELTRILEDRNLNNKSWIINTNLELNQLEKRYDARLVDRIMDKSTIFLLKSKESIRLSETSKDVEMI